MIFNLKKSVSYKAVLFYRLFPAGILKFYRVMLFVLGFVPIVIVFANRFYETEIGINLAWSYIVLPFAAATLFFEIFGSFYLKFPKIKSTNPRYAEGSGEASNIADLFEYEAAKVIDRAFEISRGLGEKELSTRTILLAMLEDSVMDKLFTRIMPTFIVIKKELKKTIDRGGLYSGKFSLFVRQDVSTEAFKLFEDSLVLRDRHGGERISVLDIMACMFDHNEQFRQFILNQNLDRGDLENLAEWYEHIWSFWREKKKFWSRENLLRQPPVGRDWVYGYARYLNKFAINISDRVEFSAPEMRLTSRTREIEQIEQILARSGENNVMLVGEEGVGREAIIKDFAALIARGRALPQLNYKKVFDLNLSLVAGASKEISDVQNILINIFNEASRAGNMIIVLKDFHNFIGEIGGLGRIDVSELMTPFLKSSNIQVLATTNPPSFHKFIEPRSELTGVFERIDISEPDKEQTLKIIQEAIPRFESKHKILVTYGAIKEIISGSDKFIRTAPFPEKAFDLLSEVVSYAMAKKERIITADSVNEVISRKTGIPLGPIGGEEKEKLSKLEELMHQEIVGQDRAVQVVSATMRRLRTGLAKRGKPAGVFLFVGPTGVGKTLTAKILAKTYFGSAARMLRFDMSEYQNQESLDRFIGSVKTNEPGQFVTAARDNPFSLILLDEIEKAEKNILNIFLQVFDEGHLTDAFGRKISFEQNIIIATSNAGADFIRDLIRQGLDPSIEKEKLIDILIKEHQFRPELLNRFDEIVIFHPLSQEQVGKITAILLESLAKRLKEQGYMFRPTQEIADYVAKAGFDPQFGARPMERVIRDKIESAIAKKILEGSIKKGQEFSVEIKDLG